VKGIPESGFAEVDDAKQARQILEAARANRLEALYVLAVTAGLRMSPPKFASDVFSEVLVVASACTLLALIHLSA
jgi:hypothetical protein